MPIDINNPIATELMIEIKILSRQSKTNYAGIKCNRRRTSVFIKLSAFKNCNQVIRRKNSSGGAKFQAKNWGEQIRF